MQSALARLHAPLAAVQIAEEMMKRIAHGTERTGAPSRPAKGDCGCGGDHRHELRAKSAA
jgi:hypothetical protein